MFIITSAPRYVKRFDSAITVPQKVIYYRAVLLIINRKTARFLSFAVTLSALLHDADEELDRVMDCLKSDMLVVAVDAVAFLGVIN